MAPTQKLINDGNHAVDEMLRGVLAAHPNHLNPRCPARHCRQTRPARGQGGAGDRRRLGA